MFRHSFSVLARHSVRDTESSRALWIPASAGMTNSRQAAGNEPSVDSRVAWPSGCEHDNDLHSRVESGRTGGQ